MKAELQDMERTCIVTRRPGEPEAMIRFVRAPDGAVAPDIAARLPGRGAWVTARAHFVEQAARKQAFSRSLKTEAKASPNLAREVDGLLEADCLQMLALANKAGLVVAGFGKVAEALEKGAAVALIEALDGAEDGRRKLAQRAHRGEAAAERRTQIVRLFTSSQLDLALGRVNVIHAALMAGGCATAFLARCARLAQYRRPIEADDAAKQTLTSNGPGSEHI